MWTAIRDCDLILISSNNHSNAARLSKIQKIQVLLISNIKFVKHEHMFSIAQWNLNCSTYIPANATCWQKSWIGHVLGLKQFLIFFNQFIWNWHNPMFRGPFCAALHTSINIQLRSRGVGPLQFAPLWRLHYSNLVFWGLFAAQLLGIQLSCGDVGLRRGRAGLLLLLPFSWPHLNL